MPAHEHELRRALAEMEAAQDETAAAQAYAFLKTSVDSYLRRSSELREEYYRLKSTVTRQAHRLAEIDLTSVTGEKAPEETKTSAAAVDFPETITVQQSPDFFFIELSYGLVNIRHIVELDVNSKTLFTVSGTRNLHADDIRKLIFHLKMYRPS